MEDKQWQPSLVGTPQGSGISPLLANILLHELDEEWEAKHSKLGVLTRYADDFVIQCRNEHQARRAKGIIGDLLGREGLQLHPKKTRIVNLSWGKEGFDFLGHHLRKTPSYRFSGKFFLNRWPSQSNLKNLRGRIRGIVHRGRNGVKNVRELVPEVNRVLRGWGNHFRTGNATRHFAKIERYVHARLARFECKRRKRTAPYRNPAYDYDWFRSLGIVPLVGTIDYPNPSLVLRNAHA